MNKNVFIISLLMLLLSSSMIKSQSVKLGFRIEPAFLFTELKDESSVSFTPFSLSLTTLVSPIDWLNFEIRPGYFLAGEDYGGFEIGAFLHFKVLPTAFSLIAGLNNHSNGINGGHNGGGSYNKKMLFKSVGIGYQKDFKLSFDLMYYWTNDKDFAYTRKTDAFGYSTNYNKKMNGILKLGFSLAWDIL